MKNKGITLVALVVTIIIMLILAGVTLGIILGDNGLFARTKQAVEKYKELQENEAKEINKIPSIISNSFEENIVKSKYTNELKAGEYVNYTDNNEVERKCVVLYDANSEYGLQIITDKAVEKVSLGGGVGNTNSTTQEYNSAKNSYNNTVVYLNNQANKYVNLKYSEEKSARSVGTLPNNPYLEVDYFSAKYTTDKLRGTDTYYTIDVEQLKKLNILNINEVYFLASRYAYNGAYTTDFCIRCVGTSGNVGADCVCSVRSNGTVYGRTCSYGLRPIFKLKENLLINGGDGSFENPYNLSV